MSPGFVLRLMDQQFPFRSFSEVILPIIFSTRLHDSNTVHADLNQPWSVEAMILPQDQRIIWKLLIETLVLHEKSRGGGLTRRLQLPERERATGGT